jgi:hypothetical protein
MSGQKVVNAKVSAGEARPVERDFFCAAEILHLRNGSILCLLAQ